MQSLVSRSFFLLRYSFLIFSLISTFWWCFFHYCQVIVIFLLSFYSFESFSHQRQLMVFHWSLRGIKSPQVTRTLLSMLADVNNGVVWIVSTRPLISESSRPFINSLVTVPSAPTTIGVWSSRLGLQNTPTASSPTSVQDMTQNNLMVRLHL